VKPGIRELLDDALDDLPRFFAVGGQAEGGWVLGGGDGPRMVTCVSVDDVREMLRRKVTKPRITLREAQLTAEAERLRTANQQMLQAMKRLKADARDMDNAAQTVFSRCACGRVREVGIICPTNQEGGVCEDGS
jgi:hypothetical protein